MSDEEFVHLHVHSEYSLLDGAARVKDICATAKAMGQPAVAITDHGVLYNAVDFSLQAKAVGIKPIIGCELYVAEGSRFDRQKRVSKEKARQEGLQTTKGYYHLIALARNEAGWRNLCQLTTKASIEGFYNKPRVDHELMAQHSEGIIALSGCISGEVPQAIIRGDMIAAEKLAQKHLEIFGQDNYFFEIQNHGIPEEDTIRDGLKSLSRRLDIPLVATGDSHYTKLSDHESHDILLAIQTGATISKEDRFRFHGPNFFIASADEMRRKFDSHDAIRNSLYIADRCNFEMQMNNNLLPQFSPLPEGMDADEYLRRLCIDGLQARYGESPSQEVRQRLASELDVIRQTGFASYFLIVWDVIHHSRCHDVAIGPGRGSAAGSIISYLLNITDIDPIRYGLIFERFLNIERIEMPDIDIDTDNRDEMIRYTIERWGKENVAQIITFGTLAARNSIRRVGTVLEMDRGTIARLTNAVPLKPGTTIESALAEIPQLREEYEQDPEVKRVIDHAKNLEGLTATASTHAAGVLISPDPLVNHIPLQRPPKSKDGSVAVSSYVSQIDMEGIAHTGLLKMDYLGLTNLAVIKEAVKFIQINHAIDIDITTIPDGDPATYSLLSHGEVLGVFQCEQSFARKIFLDMQPTCLEDLGAAIALNRPGPIQGGVVDMYLRRRRGEEEINYMGLDAYLEPILKETMGIIVYQDQVMQIAQAVAGYSMGEADKLRKAMGKKQQLAMGVERVKFCAGAEANGIDPAQASELFDYIAFFAGYGFNKAHSISYGRTTYTTAWLKANYPLEYMTALLSAKAPNHEKLRETIIDCERRGLEVLPPSVNHSQSRFSVDSRERNEIRYGLSFIKDMGSDAAASLIRERERGGAYPSLFDLAFRCPEVDKGMLEALIRSGACDDMGERKQLLCQVDTAKQSFKKTNRLHNPDQTTLFDSGQLYSEAAAQLKIKSEAEWKGAGSLGKKEKLRGEYEHIGYYVSGHPLNEYQSEIREQADVAIADLSATMNKQSVKVAGLIKSVKKITTKRQQTMAFVTIEDMSGECELVIFPNEYSSIRDLLATPEAIVLVEGTVQCPEQTFNEDGSVIEDENEGKYRKLPKILASRIFNLEAIRVVEASI